MSRVSVSRRCHQALAVAIIRVPAGLTWELEHAFNFEVDACNRLDVCSTLLVGIQTGRPGGHDRAMPSPSTFQSTLVDKSVMLWQERLRMQFRGFDMGFTTELHVLSR